MPGDPTKPPFTKREILWSNISPLLTNTGPYLAGLYDWGLTGYDGDKLLKAIHEVLFSLSLPHIYTAPQTVPTPVNASIDFLYFTLQPELGVSPPGLSLTLKDDFTGGGPFEIPFVFDNWKISFKPKSDFVKNAKLILQPGGILKASTPSPPGIIDGSISIDLVGHDPAAKMVLFGKASGSRLEADSVVVGFDSYFVWNTVTSKAEGEFGFHMEFNDASLLIQTSDADSFLKKVLPPDGLKADFNLIFGWRSDKGFYIEGSGGLELILPIHKTLLNTITVDSSKIAIEADNSNLSASIGFSGSVKLGPFTAVIDDMGIKSDLDFPPGGGNLGPVNATLEFKPPKGLGLSVDSGSVKGAGYLSFNKDEGRYIGALELRIKDEIAVKAIGILTTKLPGGQPGYSLLLLITAEFQPIQLGFGFTLNGVGGLIALNRKMNFDALRAGVRNNTLENILFPKDPVENIDSIISTLEDTFPVAEGRYSFGPMAIIGWGTPTLITAEVGLFIEVPEPVRIALIGVIKAILPDLDAPILALQINFAGTIDFEAKFITFDASLFDSRLLWLPLSGDMAFRLKWGDEPAFVMSVGGFYPGFPVPPLNLPDLRRITVNLLDGDNPRLTLSTYFAVTSNTAQFGASVDFYYSYSNNIKIKGGVGFDALFRFSPFYFTSTIHGDLGVSFKGKNIVSVSLEGTLEGPTPWHLQGSVSL